jgi:hypothetical protein
MMGFFTHVSFELCNYHLVDEGHLALQPIVECVSWKTIRVENYQLVGINCFPDYHEALHEVVKDTFVLNEQAVGVYIKAIEALHN